MFEQLINQGILFYVIAGICGIGVLEGLIVSLLYRRLVKDSANMQDPKTKLMKQIKNKYENGYRLQENVNNVAVFVEKSLRSHKIGGLNLHRLRRLGIYVMSIGMILSAAGIFLAREYEQAVRVQVNYIAALVASFLVMIAVQGVMDCAYKSKMIALNVEDYLENFLLNRLRQEPEEPLRTKNRVQPRSVSVLGKSTRIQPDENEYGNKGIMPSDTIQTEPLPVIPATAPTAAIKPASQRQEKKIPISAGIRHESLSEEELQENIDRMKQSMNEIAASNVKKQPSNKEILQNMDPKQQEEILREVLKEFLS